MSDSWCILELVKHLLSPIYIDLTIPEFASDIGEPEEPLVGSLPSENTPQQQTKCQVLAILLDCGPLA